MVTEGPGTEGLFERAMRSAQGDDLASQLKRSSLQAFAEDHAGIRRETSAVALVMRMFDEGQPDHRVSALDTSRALMNMQRSVARLAKARKKRVSEVRRLTHDDLDEARLDVREALAGSLVIQMVSSKEHPADADETLSASGETLAELALIELVAALPETSEDDATVDAIPAARPVLRRAVADLVSGWKASSVGFQFSVERNSSVVATSELSAAQIQMLDASLAERDDERLVERRRGRLDGVRTRRRLFYFEPEGGGEIHGLIEEELLPSVLEYLDGRLVDVELEVVVGRLRAGQLLHRSYRLVSIRAAGAPQVEIDVNTPSS